jgi:uncharacterized damage-inducible protein DinB
MNGKQAIRSALQGTQNLVGMYLSDLSDADLLVRPVPGANHIAWQFGHVIDGERHLMGAVPGVHYPEVPAGFSETHNTKNASSESTQGFLTKAQYLELFNKVRAATYAALEKMSDADLDKPNTGPMAKFAPTIGELIVLVSNHTLMHAGQFTVVRRKLGKPVVF